MNTVYQPSRRLDVKIARRIAPLMRRRMRTIHLDRPLVSFTFDDCPKSAIENGLPLLEAKGWRSTVYVACGLWDQTNHLGLHMSASDTKAVAASGHEIGDHTFSHQDARSVSTAEFLSDIDKNQDTLGALGIQANASFAYPYGEVTALIKQKLESQFLGARGILPRLHRRQVDLNQIGSFPLFNSERFDQLITVIQSLETAPAWLTIFTHDVCETPSPWGCTPTQLAQIIDAVSDIGADVLPISNAIHHLQMREIAA